MDRYIGLDAHASTCTLGVLGPSGKRLGSHVVETNAQALIEVLRSIPGPQHLCLEAGTLASWLYEVLSPHVAEIEPRFTRGHPPHSLSFCLGLYGSPDPIA